VKHKKEQKSYAQNNVINKSNTHMNTNAKCKEKKKRSYEQLELRMSI